MRSGRILGVKPALDLQPVLVVKILLLGVRQSHEQPVLDLLALGERASGRVQALENLLWVLVSVEADAHYAEPLESPQQTGEIVFGDDTAGRSPSLGNRAGPVHLARQPIPVLLLVAVLQPQLAELVRGLAGVGLGSHRECPASSSPHNRRRARVRRLCTPAECSRSSTSVGRRRPELPLRLLLGPVPGRSEVYRRSASLSVRRRQRPRGLRPTARCPPDPSSSDAASVVRRTGRARREVPGN